MGLPPLPLICGTSERIRASMQKLGTFTTYDLAREVFSHLPEEDIHKIVIFATHVEKMHQIRGENSAKRAE